MVRWRRLIVTFIHTWPVLFLLGRFKPEDHSMYLNIFGDNTYIHIGPNSLARVLERLLAGWSGIRGLIPSRIEEFFSSLQHPERLLDSPATYTMIAEGNILVITLWGVNLTTFPHLVPRLGLHGDEAPNVFKFSWYFVK